MRYMGSTFNSSNDLEVPAYTLYDLSVGYDLAQADPSLNGAKVQLTVNNVFDKEYVSSCANDYACFYGAERSAMAKVSFDW
jgi:iron complex outermembrane receptor protein